MTQPDFESEIIIARDVSRNFGSVQAIKNLNFHVNHGELFGIVGPDGAGKTTIMRILAGILDVSSGEAWVDGISIVKDPEGIKEHIAYMPQKFGLYPDLSVLENLIFYADLFQVPKKKRPERIRRLLGFSRLDPFENRLAGALSGGMKQKLGLACALIHEPRVLLLDEPTNGVDPVSRRDFWKILYDLLKERITIVVSTAYLDEAERTHRIALMHKGEFIRVGAPRDLKKQVVGVIIELLTSNIPRTRRLINGIYPTMDVNVFGEGLHIRIENDEQLGILKKSLSREGIDIKSINPIEPSMEDAFLSMIPR